MELNVYRYTLFIAFPKNNKSNDPTIATENAIILNPVIEISKIRFAINPPMSAPTTPKRIDPSKLPLLDEWSILFATIPTISPNKTQAIIFIVFTSSLLFHLGLACQLTD